jgi:hypothetical protein
VSVCLSLSLSLSLSLDLKNIPQLIISLRSLLSSAESANDFVAGLIGGISGLVTTQPLDIIKVKKERKEDEEEDGWMKKDISALLISFKRRSA